MYIYATGFLELYVCVCVCVRAWEGVCRSLGKGSFFETLHNHNGALQCY